MAISDWPLAERPRERLLAQGAGSLSDAELLAVILRTGLPGKSAVDLGRDLMGQARSPLFEAFAQPDQRRVRAGIPVPRQRRPQPGDRRRRNHQIARQRIAKELDRLNTYR